MNEIIINNNGGTLTVPSMQVAENFGKRHSDVLEAIENMKTENSVLKNMFIESTYKVEGNNKTYKCYDLTRDGFSLLVMGFTGKKALEWKLKYIEAFNLMEAKLKEQAKQIPQMSVNELIFEMAKSNLETEKRLKSLEESVSKTSDKLETALNIFTAPSCGVSWKDNVRATVSKMCENSGKCWSVIYGEMYTELEIEAGCNLSARVRKAQERMEKQGYTYKQRRAYCKLDAVADDKKLRAIFEGIIKKYQVRYLQGDNVQEYI